MTTEAEKSAAIAKENAETMDRVFAAIEIKRQLREITTEKWGCTDAQAADFCELHADQFGLSQRLSNSFAD